MIQKDTPPPASLFDEGTQSTLHEQSPQSVQISLSASTNEVNSDVEKQEPQPEAPPPEVDPDFITWSGPEDPKNPQNWPFKYKIWVTAAWVYSCFVTTVASSIFSSGAEVISADYHVGTTVVTLGVSLFLVVSQMKIQTPGRGETYSVYDIGIHSRTTPLWAIIRALWT